MTIKDASILCAIAGVLSMSACTSTSEFGDALKNKGGAYKDIGVQWSEGDKLVKKGTALREKGQSKKGGQRDIAKGEDLVRKGEKLKSDAEEEYHEWAEVEDTLEPIF